ncbi:hypothetical protein LFT45_10490 [Arthrobacter sp. FW305-BF8]|uniref:hypothetical protein n=1 Tax=Arthrobacter sp. FW305-BF8 TaxID=2879617 RepID=UPI001F218340|nr:hypothetical protein [Arthrobacter sp. FW305-BF8]UKA56283.1 hypothetical protein LFT45_10490 [Arthrobacter sp. FW305-BF8]
MAAPRVLATTAYLQPGGEVDRMPQDAGFDVVFSKYQDRLRTGEELIDYVKDVDAIVAGTDAFTAEVIVAAPHLMVFGRCGVGYNSIDVTAATKNGGAVTFTPGANRISIAEHALALMLNCARLIPQNLASIRAGGWDPDERPRAHRRRPGRYRIWPDRQDDGPSTGHDVIAHDPYIDCKGALRRNGHVSLGWPGLHICRHHGGVSARVICAGVKAARVSRCACVRPAARIAISADAGRNQLGMRSLAEVISAQP